VKLEAHWTNVDTNLDDLQSCLDAGSRAADTLYTDTTKFNGFLNGSLRRAVVRHIRELQSCGRDQRAALRELRDNIVQLQLKLIRSKSAVRPPPAISAEARRR
jgi:hypothetical protein